MSDTCGPLHLECVSSNTRVPTSGIAEYECPECAGTLEESSHFCDCNRCHDDGDDEWECVACAWRGDDHDAAKVGQALKVIEAKKLAEWKAWAAGKVAS